MRMARLKLDIVLQSDPNFLPEVNWEVARVNEWKQRVKYILARLMLKFGSDDLLIQ